MRFKKLWVLASSGVFASLLLHLVICLSEPSSRNSQAIAAPLVFKDFMLALSLKDITTFSATVI